MNKTNIYLYSSIRSVRETDGRGAWMFAWTRKDGTPGTRSKMCSIHSTANLAEIILLTDALTWLNQYGEPCQIWVYMNNRIAFRSVSEWIKDWRTNDWKNKKGDEVNEWYKVMDKQMEGHKFGYEIEKGEYSSWLASEVEHRKGEEACLISLETLTVPEKSIIKPKS